MLISSQAKPYGYEGSETIPEMGVDTK